MPSVLVVEDDPDIAKYTRKLLQDLGHEVVGEAAGGEEGITLARERRPDLVLMDVALAGPMDGISAAEVVITEVGAPVLFVSASTSSDALARIAKLGTFGFVAKPFRKAQLRASIEVTLRAQRLQPSLRPVASIDPMTEPLDDAPRIAVHTLMPTSRGKIIGNHPSIWHALQIVERVADSDVTVLITGESGTGKELFAAALHDASGRRRGPFVAVNCGAIPENLIEGELFGHAKGAFTGAVAARSGIVAAAEGGTLMLDEIGDMPAALQVRLLRLLQEREYTPLGSTQVVKCNVRVVAATHRDLEAEVTAGRFRADLFYRLNVVHITLPALRERREDIPALAERFLRASLSRAGRHDVHGFSKEAMDALCAYDWPGNVRSLENVVERAVLLSHGPMIQVSDLPPKLQQRPADTPHASSSPSQEDAPIDLAAAIEEYQASLIREALQRAEGNKTKAARLLGMNRTTLIELIKRKRLAVP
jgi:DNA-binding NtrC family response regulator